MNKKIKIRFIVVGIITIIISIMCIVGIFMLNNKNLNKTVNNYSNTEGENGYVTDADNGNINYQLNNVRDPVAFYSVEKAIKKYNDENFTAEKMKYLEGKRINSYLVEGKSKNENKKCFILKVDIYNLTCEINEIKSNSINEIKLEIEEKEIQENGNNNFEYIQMSYEDMARMYYKEIIQMELNDYEKAYSMLDEKYKGIRFPTIESYKKYIEEMQDILKNSVISKYNFEEKEEYREYILVDNFNNSYTIRATGVKEYKILLDNYTIKVDTYEEEYNKQEEEEKVKYNIYIFIQMINTKDYSNAYTLLAKGFKDNYFKTEKAFEEYMKDKWFNYNLQTELNIKQEGKNYVCDLTLRDGPGAASKQANKTIIMQLKEGTDFVMSFTVE